MPTSFLDRRAVALMRRPMVGVEALFYEHVGAAAVARVLGPSFAGLSGRVLDVGCGGGALRLGSVGVDPAVGQLRRSRRRGVTLPLAAASAVTLPFRSGAFDGVLASCSLKHWPDLAAGVAECARVLVPGGRLVLAEIDGGRSPDSGDLQRFAALTRIPRPLRWTYSTLARRTFVPATPPPDEVAAVATAAGLHGIAWHRIDSLPFYIVTADR